MSANGNNEVEEEEKDQEEGLVPNINARRRWVFLLVENPRKTNNLGPILRCAAAFAVAQVVAVGFDKCNTEGSHGAARHVSLVAYPSLKQAIRYIRLGHDQGGCACTRVLGLLGGAPGAYHSPTGYSVEETNGWVAVTRQETSPGPLSFPAHSRPFETDGNVCLVINKSNKGLASHLAAVCDSFVHVPHANSGSAHSMLDTPTCLSITLHHFTSWAKYDERTFQGHKFGVARVKRGRLETVFGKTRNVAAERDAKRQDQKREAEDTLSGAVSLFDTGDASADY